MYSLGNNTLGGKVREWCNLKPLPVSDAPVTPALPSSEFFAAPCEDNFADVKTCFVFFVVPLCNLNGDFTDGYAKTNKRKQLTIL